MRTKELILEAVSNTGQWYELPNYTALSAEQFIKQFGHRFSQKLNNTIKYQVSRIQRQCDSIAIELKTFNA